MVLCKINSNRALFERSNLLLALHGIHCRSQVCCTESLDNVT